MDEQQAFDKWLRKTKPSGDASEVNDQWLESSDYEDWLDQELGERNG